ncbi:MAG: cyclic nucleotide-binding domain-containing protein [Pseudomonadota bacterium]
MIDTQCLREMFSEDLNDDELQVLAEIVTIRQLADDEVLIREGEVDHSLHGVISGALGVEKMTGGNDKLTLHVLRRCDLAGGMGFVDGMPHTATLRAIGPTQIMTLERERMESFVVSHPILVYHIMRTIIRKVHHILRSMNFQYMELTNYITHQHGRY